MEGFDPKFASFPEYIIGITREIWEDRRISAIREYYAKDIIVRSPASIVKGNEGVVAATMSTLAEFPDRTLLGEDVIWCGEPKAGMLSSHRILSQATHAKDGLYGKATGKKLRYRIIADCHAVKNQVNDEWLIRDQGAIVRQLGWCPREYARDIVAAEGGPENCQRPFSPKADRKGAYKGRGNDSEWGKRYADILERMMASGFDAIPASYDRACHLEYAGGVTGHGHGDADSFWLGLRASFPDARFTISHRMGMEEGQMAPRAALRWSLDGVHSGHGAFGPPSGAKVHVMGISHAEFGPWGLRREWAVYDETAVWKQIILDGNLAG